MATSTRKFSSFEMYDNDAEPPARRRAPYENNSPHERARSTEENARNDVASRNHREK